MQVSCRFARRASRAVRTAFVLAVLGTAFPTGPATAQQGAVYVVGNDRGGLIGQRAREIDRLNEQGVRVEIRGDICLSSCTMFLGAGDLCISPGTTFGFHGPSDFGRPLSADRFEFWSAVMARYYAEPIRGWFMEEARYRQFDYLQLSGADLIDMGFAAC